MKVPLSWLKEYVEINESPEKLARDLLSTGTKVENIETKKGDSIFELEITPNRPDCLSVIGVAREIAAIYKRKLCIPAVFSTTRNNAEARKKVKFVVKDRYLCPSYSLGVIDSLKPGPSPDWIADRLEKSGVRSLNNIIDITNYVMLETGQPMHAFDYDKVTGAMVLRASKKGEVITTLDGIERKLPDQAIIIEDDQKIIDLAGLMGGRESEIEENTVSIILHVPLYNPAAIRRTSQATGLRTEASNRFEKQLDPAAHRFAFERAAGLFRTIASGRLASDIESVGYPPPQRKIQAPVSLIKKTLGLSLTKDKIIEFLERFGFAVESKGDLLNVVVPSFRTDISEPIDLSEEAGRLYGYDRFPRTQKVGQLPKQLDRVAGDLETKIKQTLASLGLREIYTSTLTGGQTLEDMGFASEDCLRVANRLVIDFEYLRPTIFVGLLTSAKLNQPNFNRFSFFEVGRVFEKTKDKDGLPKQPKKVATLFVNSSFTAARGLLETFFQKIGISADASFSQASAAAPFGKEVANICIGDKLIGKIGRINPSVLEKFDLDVSTFGFEIDLEPLRSCVRVVRYKPPPRFPTVKENISLFLPPSTNFSIISEAIKSGGGKTIYRTQLLEDTLVGGKRSVLLAIEYYHPTHTLRGVEVAKIRKAILEELKKVGASLRVANEH